MTPREEWHLDTHRLGRRVLVFDRLDSTSTLAAALAADPANDGLAVLADEQTAGRGRQGHTWTCPPGSGVLLSVLLFPPTALCRPALLTAWAAVSVCETIRQVANVQARIKWPNDVLIRGMKVCGILLEQGAGGRGPGAGGREGFSDCGTSVLSTQYSVLSTTPLSRPPVVVAGIGLNLSQSPEYFASVGLPQAASLSTFTDGPLDRNEVVRQLLRQLDEEYARLLAGDVATLESCWKWRIGLLGKEVVAECVTGPQRGRLRDLTWDGVELELKPGTVCKVPPEAILHLSPA